MDAPPGTSAAALRLGAAIQAYMLPDEPKAPEARKARWRELCFASAATLLEAPSSVLRRIQELTLCLHDAATDELQRRADLGGERSQDGERSPPGDPG